MTIIDKVQHYEQALNCGKSIYMDANDLLDVYDYYVEHQKVLNAESCLHLALRIHPKNDDVLIAYAVFLRSVDKREEAYNVAKTIENQHHPDVLLFYGEDALCRASLQEADDIFNTIPEDEQPYQWRLQLDVAQIYFDYGFYQKANQWLDKCEVNKNPEFRKVIELRAKTSFCLGQYATAEYLINKSIDINPYNEQSWIYLSEIQLVTSEFEKAIESAEYAIAINANSKQAKRCKLLALIRLPNIYGYSDVVNYFKSLPRGTITDVQLISEIVEMMMNHFDYNEAEHVVQTALASAVVNTPERQSLLSLYCKILINKGEIEKAKQVAQSRILNGENYQPVMRDLVVDLLMNDCVQEAVLNLKEAMLNETFSVYNAFAYLMPLEMLECYEEAESFWDYCFSGYEYFPMEYMATLAVAAHELKSSMFIDILEFGSGDETVRNTFLDFYNVSTWQDVMQKANNEVKSW